MIFVVMPKPVTAMVGGSRQNGITFENQWIWFNYKRSLQSSGKAQLVLGSRYPSYMDVCRHNSLSNGGLRNYPSYITKNENK